MFCYIKYSGESAYEIIESDKIHHFQTPFNKEKLYKVRCGNKYREAAIAFVEETLEDLQRRIEKERPKVLPSSLLFSASEITDEDEKIKKRQKFIDKTQLLKEKLAAMKACTETEETMENENKKDGSKEKEGFCFEKDTEEKREQTYSHKKTSQQQGDLLKKRKRHREEENDEEKGNKKGDKRIRVLKESKIKKKLKEGITQLNQSEISLSDDISKDSKIADSVATPHTTSPIKSVELSSNSIATDEYPEDFQVPKSPLVEISSACSLMLPPNSESWSTKDVTPPNEASNFDELVPSPSEPEFSTGPSSVTHSGSSHNSNNNNKHAKHSKKKKSHLTKKHARKTSDKSRSKKIEIKIEKVNIADCLQKLNEKLMNKFEESEQSRKKFEASVLQSLSTIESNWKQLQSAHTAAGNNDENVHLEDINKPPLPGFIRKDGNEEKIHCGQNIWIGKMTYDNAVFNARSDGMFVKNMALAIFGDKELKGSSVTGASSNRTKSDPKPSLNPTKALAVRDIFRYFLESYRHYDKDKIEELVGDYQMFIRQKISDMNRVTKRVVKTTNKKESKNKSAPPRNSDKNHSNSKSNSSSSSSSSSSTDSDNSNDNSDDNSD